MRRITILHRSLVVLVVGIAAATVPVVALACNAGPGGG
jgi:hypothetical protein